MSTQDKLPDTFDAIVVGSGISGGYAAMELCKKGYKTLILERGRDVKHIEEANITFPDCPLSEAKVQYEMEQKSKFGLLMASLEPVKLMAKSYTLPETVLFPKSMLPTKSFSGMLSGIDFDNNKIIIRRKKILHTQFELFDDIDRILKLKLQFQS